MLYITNAESKKLITNTLGAVYGTIPADSLRLLIYMLFEHPSWHAHTSSLYFGSRSYLRSDELIQGLVGVLSTHPHPCVGSL